MTEKEEKKISKGGRIFAGIFAFIVLLIAINSGGNLTTPTKTTTQVQKVDVVQERIDRINEVFTEDPSFLRAEKIEDNVIGILFSDTPTVDSIDNITRGQAVNLSNDVNGVASVKTLVGGAAQMFCVATKGTISSCSDYR